MKINEIYEQFQTIVSMLWSVASVLTLSIITTSLIVVAFYELGGRALLNVRLVKDWFGDREGADIRGLLHMEEFYHLPFRQLAGQVSRRLRQVMLDRESEDDTSVEYASLQNIAENMAGFQIYLGRKWFLRHLLISGCVSTGLVYFMLALTAFAAPNLFGALDIGGIIAMASFVVVLNAIVTPLFVDLVERFILSK